MTQEEYNTLVNKLQPNNNFNNNWNTFYSYDFGDTFLLNSKAHKNYGMTVYDGGNLLKGLKTDKKVLTPTSDNKLINIVGYTFPKDIQASKKTNLIKPAKNEICWWAEIDKDNNIVFDVTYGKIFSDFVENYNISQAPYKTTINEFRKYFEDNISQAKFMTYIFKVLNIEKEALNTINYNKFFTSKVMLYLNNLVIEDEFKVEIFIKKSQLLALEESGTISGGEQVYSPGPNDIFIWLVSKDYVIYDKDFVIAKVGTNVAKNLKSKNTTVENLKHLILEYISVKVYEDAIEEDATEKALKSGIVDALIQVWVNERRENNALSREIYEKDSVLFFTFECASFIVSKLESKKLNDNRWNPKIKPYRPLFSGDTILNAIICGIINGILDEMIAVPDTIVFFSKILGSEAEKNEFFKQVSELFNDEEFVKSLIENAIQGYEEALKEGNIEKLYYHLAHDAIQIVSFLIGIYQAVIGVASFVNFTKKGLLYLKLYGKNGINKLKKLNKKELGEVFDNLEASVGGKGPKGFGKIIGKYSKRPFNPEMAGGPILNLDWRITKITLEGVDEVKRHLSRFGFDDWNEGMIIRLEKIINNEIEVSDFDKRFYSHELREFERYKALGYEHSKNEFIPENVWNDAHTATLEDFKLNELTEFEGKIINNLYHPDVQD